jgi:TonB family protein
MIDRRSYLVVILVSLVAGSAVFAAEAGAQVMGTVYSSSWEALPATQVILTNLGNCSLQQASTDDQGKYDFPNVEPGRYRLLIAKPGAGRLTVPGFQVKVAETQSRKHFLLLKADSPDTANDPCPERQASGADIKAAKLRKQVPPVYPEPAKSLGITGAVTFEAVIDESGRISTLRPLASPHPSLTAAAERALQRWEYSPTLLDGKPVPAITPMTINFTLTRR